MEASTCVGLCRDGCYTPRHTQNENGTIVSIAAQAADWRTCTQCAYPCRAHTGLHPTQSRRGMTDSPTRHSSYRPSSSPPTCPPTGAAQSMSSRHATTRQSSTGVYTMSLGQCKSVTIITQLGHHKQQQWGMLSTQKHYCFLFTCLSHAQVNAYVPCPSNYCNHYGQNKYYEIDDMIDPAVSKSTGQALSVNTSFWLNYNPAAMICTSNPDCQDVSYEQAACLSTSSWSSDPSCNTLANNVRA